MLDKFSLYQLLVPFFALLIIARAISRYLHQHQTVKELFISIIVWSGVSFVAIFPDFSMQWLSKLTGIKSGFYALIFFTLVLLVYGFLQVLIKLEENERNLTELVRKIALRDLKHQE